MKVNKHWSVRDGTEQNRERDKLLTIRMKAAVRQQHETWRKVRVVAETTLDFAYQELSEMRPAKIRSLAKRCMKEILEYEYRARGRVPLLVSDLDTPLSHSELCRAQQQLRLALATLVISVDANTTPFNALYWRPPSTTVERTYFAIRVDSIANVRKTTPTYLRLPNAIAEVLGDAAPWIRFCELCGRLFFKVKRQQVCSRRCKHIFHARQRSHRQSDLIAEKDGNDVERRGRPRKNYGEPIEEAHNDWLEMAEKHNKQFSKKGVRTPWQ